jgi:anti-sigma factor RsiW
MHCENVQQQLKRFAVGDLPVADRQAVQAHLAECGACRARLAALDSLAGIVAGTPISPVPSGFASRVMAAARQQRESQPVAAWNLMRWWRLTTAPMHAAAAAVLIIGLSLGVVMSWSSVSSSSQAQTAAQANPVDAYQIDYLGEAPSGSLADSYLTLVSATNEGGR